MSHPGDDDGGATGPPVQDGDDGGDEGEAPVPAAQDSVQVNDDSGFRDFCDLHVVRSEHNEAFRVTEIDFRLEFGFRDPDSGELVYYDFRNDVRARGRLSLSLSLSLAQ
ncbi:MAG: hypothetical protein GY738_20195 [Pseudoalteromonas sp.]|nr:hypothetical protein [Pseudoalteromonas sp.]